MEMLSGKCNDLCGSVSVSVPLSTVQSTLGKPGHFAATERQGRAGVSYNFLHY